MKRSAVGWTGLAVAVTAASLVLGTTAATASNTRTLVLISRSTTTTLFMPRRTCVLRSVPQGAHIGGVPNAPATPVQHTPPRGGHSRPRAGGRRPLPTTGPAAAH